jgi:hypothetical protein
MASATAACQARHRSSSSAHFLEAIAPTSFMMLCRKKIFYLAWPLATGRDILIEHPSNITRAQTLEARRICTTHKSHD